VRRRALIGIASIGFAWSVAPHSLAQRSGKMPVIGLLDGGERTAWWAGFRQQMRDLGYVEGTSVAYEARFARGQTRQLPALAQELIRKDVAIIVTASSAASVAAKAETDRIPIVIGSGADHVSLGLVASLARPGGNVTGMSSVASELTAKRLELLREVLPKMSRLAVLWQADNVGSRPAIRDLESATRSAKVSLRNLGVRKPEEIAPAVGSAVQDGVEALFVILAPLTYGERGRIGELALKHKLPAVHGSIEMLEPGGLVSYGVNYIDLFRRAAVYVDRILKGARPAALPIEQPTKFETGVNLKTAKALGISIPGTVLVRADRVIK